MANEEQLAILKQGVDVWNRWREENPLTEIDLSDADLSEVVLLMINLSKANLSKADLSSAILLGANFSEANLSESNLSNADLWGANFSDANLYGCFLRDAILHSAKLERTDLSKANLSGAILHEANLSQSNLFNADLSRASLYFSLLIDTNFSKARMGNTKLITLRLDTAIGLEQTIHSQPSTISIDTLHISQGQIPEAFLRSCGLYDLDIEYAKLANPELTAQEVSEITHRIFELKDTRPIQISPLFISYSHANSDFVDKIETKLDENGIRFWRDIHDATAGRLETQIDRAIRHNPTVLLILSEHSTASDWVEHEARLARKLEKELGREVLCPIALDDSWKTCNWPERIKEQITEKFILDFSNWEDDAELDTMFKRLIDGLDMFYKK